MRRQLQLVPPYSSAVLWERECVAGVGSVLHGRESLWSSDNLLALRTCLVGDPHPDHHTLVERLAHRLRGAPPKLARLAAEVLWVLYLFDSSLDPDAKREVISRISSGSGEPIPGSVALEEIGAGIRDLGARGEGAIGEMVHLIHITLELKREWSNLPLSGELYAAVIDHAERVERSTIRHALLHLLFPAEFEPIPHLSEKRAVVDAFADLAGREDPFAGFSSPLFAIDEKISRIRRTLEEDRPGERIDFYAPELSRQWSGRVSTRPEPVVDLPGGWPDVTAGVRRGLAEPLALFGRKVDGPLLLAGFLSQAEHRKETGSAGALLSLIRSRGRGPDLFFQFGGLITRCNPVVIHFGRTCASVAGSSDLVCGVIGRAAEIRDAVTRGAAGSGPQPVSTRHVLGALLGSDRWLSGLGRYGYELGALRGALARYAALHVAGEHGSRWNEVLQVPDARAA